MRAIILKLMFFGSLTILFSMLFFIKNASASILPNTTNDTGLTQQEIEGLQLMREEEKLARDVYAEMYKKWNLQIFDNISQSENQHTEAIKRLLDLYDIEDPYIEGVGKYTNHELEKLYFALIEQGSNSLNDALKVGATIEDLDIADLDKLIMETKKEDILFVYKNLNRGSRNHLRAFMGQLDRSNIAYTPQYISKNRFDLILAGNMERGQFAQTGNPNNPNCRANSNQRQGNKGNFGRGSGRNQKGYGNRGNCRGNGRGNQFGLNNNSRRGWRNW